MHERTQNIIDFLKELGSWVDPLPVIISYTYEALSQALGDSHRLLTSRHGTTPPDSNIRNSIQIQTQFKFTFSLKLKFN